MNDQVAMILLGDPETPVELKEMAFNVLMELHYQELIGLAERILRHHPGTGLEGADAVQEVLAKLTLPEVAASFNPRLELRPWLCRLVANQTKDLLRKERRHRRRSTADSLNAVPSTSNMQSSSCPIDLERLLMPLDEIQKKICLMMYLEGFTAAEIASFQGWTVEKVYRELHVIRTTLRETGSQES